MHFEKCPFHVNTAKNALSPARRVFLPELNYPHKSERIRHACNRDHCLPPVRKNQRLKHRPAAGLSQRHTSHLPTWSIYTTLVLHAKRRLRNTKQNESDIPPQRLDVKNSGHRSHQEKAKGTQEPPPRDHVPPYVVQRLAALGQHVNLTEPPPPRRVWRAGVE